MKILITGASGFIGRYVAAAALRRGYQVRAVVRAGALSWQTHPDLEVVQLDLRDTDRLRLALRGIDRVIHLAAVLAGTAEQQRQGTVLATQSLLAVLKEWPVQQLIAVSTLAVYDYLALSPGTLITESIPLEAQPHQRDGYTQTKLAQEILVRQFADQTRTALTILRPGIVYGKDRLWTASLGVNFKDRLWVCIGSGATLPLLYVEHCADAILQALLYPGTSQTINLMDDSLPTQKAYLEALGQSFPVPPHIVLPWAWVNQVSGWAAQQPWIQNRVQLPGLLVPARVQARFKPFAYSNARAKQFLDWSPQFSLCEALARSVRPVSLTNLCQEAQP